MSSGTSFTGKGPKSSAGDAISCEGGGLTNSLL